MNLQPILARGGFGRVSRRAGAGMSRRNRKKTIGPGQSKHRKARVLKFSQRHPTSKKAWGGKRGDRP